MRTRRAPVVESGLNDGLALPVILLFASMSAHFVEPESKDWLGFAVAQRLLGPLVGIFGSLLGAKVLPWAKEYDYSSQTHEGIGAIALAGGVCLAAIAVGGNGFIAAFVAGLSFGHGLKGRCQFVYEFTESEGRLLSWAAFFLLGLALVPETFALLTPGMLAIILLSLFVVRPIAVWVSLLGFVVRPIAVWVSLLGTDASGMGQCAETVPVIDSAKPVAGIDNSAMTTR